jgi:DNA polymerase
MPNFFYDTETRSAADLKVIGAHRYAADPTTEVLCVGFAADDGPVEIWTPGQPIPEPVTEAARDSSWQAIAHNASFDRQIMERILHPRFGWPLVPPGRHRCTMAKALAAALPGALGKAIEALGLPYPKDRAGATLMRRMAKPKPGGGWIDDPASLERLQKYLRRDVEALRALYRALPPLTEDEQQLWQLDAIINSRGFHTDGALLEAAHRVVAAAEAKLQSEFRELTGLNSTNQVAKLIAWLATAGCIVTDVQKGTLKAALRRKELAPEVRRAIELRLELAHASAAKVEALRAWRGLDGRVRGTLQYHGAATGRWVGRGPQPQNFKRDGENIEAKIAAVMNGGAGLTSPVEAVGDIARAMITAAPGHRLLIGDFSGIESRVLAWASRQQSKLDAWETFDRDPSPDNDPYVIIGRAIGHPAETARAYGKICDLAFGYQGGAGAWKNMAPEDDASDEATIKRYRDAWRRQHPATERFWDALDRAAVRAVARPATSQRCDRFLFQFDAPFLRISLPSGRSLSYPFPRIETGKYGSQRVMFLDNAAGKFVDCRFGHGSYGGLWTENIVSAIARDLLAAALTRLEAAGYPVVLHVHDEVVCEVPDGFGSTEEFKRILCEVPAWAEGLPIAAKVRNGLRFSKAENEGVPQVTIPAENAPAAFPEACSIRVEPESAIAPTSAGTPWDDPLGDIYADAAVEAPPAPADNGSAGLQWSTPIIEEVPPGSAEFETILTSLSEEDRAIVRPAAAGNGRDQDAGQQQHSANGKGYDETRSNYSEPPSEEHSDEPFASIHNRLLRKGYVPTQDFPYDLPGGKILYYERRYELKPGITATKKLPRKTSRYYHVKDGVCLNGTGPRRIIYNWPAIMNAGPGASVFVTEGANKSKPINDKGLLATATPYHVWPPECVAALAEQHLFYLEDHDFDDANGRNKGREHSAAAKAANTATAASFRIVPTAHLWKYLPPGTRGLEHGDDVKDWLERGGDPARLLDICREIPAEDSDPLFWHGEPDPRGRRKWRIKNLMPAIGAGLLSGQWGTYKTFMAIELGTAVIKAEQFVCGRPVVEPCGVLILATEGAFELRDRVGAAVHEKYPKLAKAPITWRESCPALLTNGAAAKLIRIIEEAGEECKARFKMPLGLVIIDVLADAAGYAKAGDENDPAVCQRLMSVLHHAGKACECFVLAVDHFGKTVESGTRGGSSKEGSADLVFACLGEREVSGTVVNTRLALRKVRGGPQGQEFPFRGRLVPIPDPDEDSESDMTCVIQWETAASQTAKDPWEADRQSTTKLAMKALRRAMMKLIPTLGIMKTIEPDLPAVLVIDQEPVREEFYATTVAPGDTPKQKQAVKRQRFHRTLERAETQSLIGQREIEGVTYLWFIEQ